MLKRVKIEGYKSLRSVEVNLEPLTVLFGPNAAGKSNFLDALQLLSRMANYKTLKQAFDPPYRGAPLESFTFGPAGVQGLLEQESATFSIEVDVELSPAVVQSVNAQIQKMKKKTLNGSSSTPSKVSASIRERNLRYRIQVEILPKSGILRVTDEYLAALNSRGEPTGKRSAFLEYRDKRLHLRMEGQSHPTYYDQHLNHSLLSLPLYPPHYPHLIAMQKELVSWLFFYFEPREHMRMSSQVEEMLHIGFMGEKLAPYLHTLEVFDKARFRVIEKALHAIIPSITAIKTSLNNVAEVELTFVEDGIPIPSRLMSGGTLRILGLLCAGSIKDTPALLGFEEPENGIHPRRIQLIARLLETRAASGDTQLIVTTHSPILPDLIPETSLFVCTKKDGQTRITPFQRFSFGAIWNSEDKKRALNDEEALTTSERIMRGDFDA